MDHKQVKDIKEIKEKLGTIIELIRFQISNPYSNLPLKCTCGTGVSTACPVHYVRY